MAHWNRAAGFVLGVGLVGMAACGVVPRASDMMLGYQPSGGTRPIGAAPAALPASMAPAANPNPAPDSTSPRPLPFFSALDRAARHHERGVAELQRGNADLADVEFHKALGLLMDPATSGLVRASYRPLRPLIPPEPPRWEDRPLAPTGEVEDADLSPSDEGDPPPLAPALITPEDVKAIEREAKKGGSAIAVDARRFDVPIVVNDQVQAFLHLFSTRKSDLVTRAFERASRYLPMMRGIFRERGLPLDLLNLAFIESAFNPHARSRAGATGIWQFIETTGRRFGMRSGFWADLRRDPELSTRGAADYLKTLYGIFESWPLALAAYNAGEGTLQSAIARQKSTDFWKLRLPKETQLFVPAFMAMTIIAKDPARFGFAPPPERELQADVVPLKVSVDLRTIARAARTTPEVIRSLNPALIRGATPPGPFSLRVPAGSGDRLLDRLAELPRSHPAPWAQHRARKGETWKTLARRHKVPVGALLELNGRDTAGPLAAGTTVLVPGRGRTRRDAEIAPAPRGQSQVLAAAHSAPEKRYTVKRGDTLAKIAKAHKVRMEDLARLNGFDVRKPLRAGQILLVRSAGAVVPPQAKAAVATDEKAGAPAAPAAADRPEGNTPKPRSIRYTVKAGDSLWTIAQAHGVSLDDLKRWNRLGGRTPLMPGKELQIRSPQAS